MTYENALQYIHSRLRFGIKTGLDRIERLCNLIGDPQDSLKIVHIAGTNGKGSTCAMLARVFKTAKLKTGLFISPYIEDFCERIQINGQPIGHDELADLTEQIIPLVEQIEREGDYPTEFEIVTAIAFKYFYDKGCDYVICETGLGGRLDSTNVIKHPLATVITAIGMDHTGILGDTIEQITAEKCGIIKPEGITVSYPLQQKAAMNIIESTAKEKNNKLTVPSLDELSIFSCQLDGSRICYKDEIYNVSLPGEHQIYNALTVIETCHELQKIGVPLHQNDIEHGVLHVDFPCRFEIMSHFPLIIMDGAHNSHAMNMLKGSVQSLLKGKSIHLIIGMLNDKDVEQSLSIIAPLCKSVITVNVDNPRVLDGEQLCQLAKKYCDNCTFIGDWNEAIGYAADRAKEDDGAVLICGSLYLDGDMRPLVRAYIANRQ